jgi:hypothetical protein
MVMTQDVVQLQLRLAEWLGERVPSDWLSGPVEVEVDREEAMIVVPLAPGVAAASFREATRDQRIRLAQQAEEAFGVKISWGTSRDGRRRLFTTVRAPVAVALAMPERRILDGLVTAGVAADRAEAVAWCVRLVGRHEADWLRDLSDGVASSPPRPRDRPIAI